MIRVALSGARGRMGGLIMEEIARADDMELVAAFDVVGIGSPVRDGIFLSDPRRMGEELRETRSDVLIDFTVASAAVENAVAAATEGVALVIGTTGLSKEQLSRMQEAIEDHVPAVISPNFSVGVNIFWKLVEQAAAALKDYDAEVVEAHHNKKRDAPSGTALKAVEILKKETGIENVSFGREGIDPRGREIGVHAVRAGDIVGDHLVLFAGPGERIEIRHQAHSRSAFASGAVRAARWVVGARPGVHSMAEVLDV
ncbi:MAG: dihydrodipicolinate reductase [Methanosaeta sp. PtaB.Bin039]|nr:MAG: dihydrodipicolinate reductase [Methanosaeta sp. PtaB.Bin039]OPY47395.1 MAG: dihydrodipicolinate reductase [Methanosaeta sp. PtaU1.Bin028]HOT07124.1 4-hydroxy-tetrahydrodipicolinate reductase [Methanotrichaceae archaeon]HQF17068.1 4-hydroxy-tetrahydrodipicolinate reductase [Methanotrichaceae archaeon]HQI91689.1 4-hydroxy-tetrahydrodipicolinate reductase [Methanotrichaceae archaeon]